MKTKIYLLIFLIILGISIYFNVTDKKSEISFSKKQECQKFQYEIENKLADKYPEHLKNMAFFGKVFYSPVKDSCLYTFSVLDLTSNKETRYLNDVLINESLHYVATSKNPLFSESANISIKFDNVVSMYRNIDTKKNDLPESYDLLNF